MDRQGRVLGNYNKVHLVPFGEYVPFQKYLPFLGKISQATGNYTGGRIGKILELDDRKIGVLICYESIFAPLARKQTARGADYLVVMTNDAWFGRTSAPYQHFSQAVLRAVENRRTLIRAANTGLSGIILPSGRYETTLGLYEAGYQLVTAPELKVQTIYLRIGDMAGRICFGLSLILMIMILFIRRKEYA